MSTVGHRLRRFAGVGCVAVGALIGAGCSSDGRTLAPTNRTMPPTTLSVPALLPGDGGDTAAPTTEATSNVVIDLLRSPENATAEITGSGASYADAVTVDGEPADVISFVIDPDDSFTVRVWIDDEGAHTVCIGGGCGRVYTLAPDAQSPEEVVELIERAMPLAQQIVDYPTLFPNWTVEIGGLLSGTGGTTDAERNVVTIYRNRNRTVDDFVRTIVHEMGHVADDEWLDDDDRVAYRAIRGIPADTPWRTEGSRGLSLDEWQLQPSEDFAEVMAMIWSDGRFVPRTDTLAAAPDAAQLAAIDALVGPD